MYRDSSIPLGNPSRRGQAWLENAKQTALFGLLRHGNSLYRKVASRFFTRHTFGGTARYNWRRGEEKELAQSKEFFEPLHDKYRGERCVIIGNGPSLNRQDLTLLRNEVTFGANYIFLNFDKMGYLPTFLSVVNFLVAEQRCNIFNRLSGTTKVFPTFLRYCMMPSPDTYFLNADVEWRSSTDITEGISWRSTVTFFNMQIAYYLGFDEVYLIGMDHSFAQPKKGVEGTVITSPGDDPNHFHKDYFGTGHKWQKADLEAIEKVYGLAKDAFEQDGRHIFNATDGGQLEVFERVSYERTFVSRP